jgi:hypothetical protein
VRNITITLEEIVARWVRLKAAEEDTSVARWVGQLIAERMRDEEQYDSAQNEFFAIRPRRLKREGGYPSRDELHDRPRRSSLRR